MSGVSSGRTTGCEPCTSSRTSAGFGLRKSAEAEPALGDQVVRAELTSHEQIVTRLLDEKCRDRRGATREISDQYVNAISVRFPPVITISVFPGAATMPPTAKPLLMAAAPKVVTTAPGIVT